MSNQIYVLIYNGDGDTHVEQVKPEDILNAIQNGEYGEDAQFLSAIPGDSDTNMWGCDTYLLLKCEVVTPKPVEVVKRWTL